MTSARSTDPAVLGFSRSDKITIGTVCAAVGVAVAGVLPWLARLLADVRWVPYGGPIRAFGNWDDEWSTVLRLGCGLLLGLALAAYIVFESPVVAVGTDKLTIRQKGRTRYIDRPVIARVFQDRRDVVVASAEGVELFRGDIEGGATVVREAFESRGYPWQAD